MKIYVTDSPSGSGKDTFMRYCSLWCNTQVLSTIDPIKLMLQREGLYQGTYTRLGWIDETKGEAERNLLSEIKCALYGYNKYPLHWMYDKIDDRCDLVFLVVREYDQFILLLDTYQAQSLQVIRDVERGPLEQSFINNHPSFKYDVTITNNGSPEELKAKAKTFVQEIVGVR